jgi:lysozyme family protein
MSRVVLTDALKQEYDHLFATCDIDPARAAEVDALIDALLADRGRYHAVAGRLKMPWFLVAALHYAHTGRDFSVHLHNGDPLTERTRHWPDGRPTAGEPPFSWEDSATDALCCWHFERWDDWSIAGVLFILEGHDSWGYRLHHPQVLSPYLWNYATHYTQGKYVADDTWSETAIAQSCGVAVLLRRLAERGLIGFSQRGERSLPLLRFSTTDTSPSTEVIQRFLNTLPGIFVKVDGIAGPKTSDAFHHFSGYYLLGDPRAQGPGQ